MTSCITCGMPFEGEHKDMVGLQSLYGPVCTFCSVGDKIKTGDEIFEGGVQFFLSTVAGGDLELAQRLVRKNMKSLPYWQEHSFEGLSGPEATDEEFQIAMMKL
ncbi:MAG: hypothetical protein UT30_C0019G0002 [Candidatus Uhrbacteria bacterium GW2011_GWF2_39_13]|uniref:Uncharacterized protein n=1 Tax=Candidatus Uhrbacteria bacterium GW2011_GWF2_39_13 TaxID=1618995 RepID=A0A0G0MTM3_9BACT|nr:MAG: hypothetical protein UT30_C0019G0002 [Candidatus Uhrbacteria bacterium GW2011_GWF2_39_13]